MARGSTVKEMTANFGKLDKFERHDFRRWQMKMHFLLTTLKVVYVLTTPIPELLEENTVEAIKHRANQGGDSLESKYMAEDASSKKFLTSCLLRGRIFKHSLNHGKDDLSLVQLGSNLLIEESLREQESDKGKGKEVR
ncbi:hypothetical protein Tco_0199990, partial [Tanacetum coccineum]